MLPSVATALFPIRLLTTIVVMADDKTENDLIITQNMIDVLAARLISLRTQCATSAGLIQQELETLEGKLIKFFSNQLVAKHKLNGSRNENLVQLPSLFLWLQVVGLSNDSVHSLCEKVKSLEELQEKSDPELKSLINVAPLEHERLCRALQNLRKYTDLLKRGGNITISERELSWHSWDTQLPTHKILSPRTGRSRITRASVPSEESLNNNRASAIPPSASASSISSLNAHCVLASPQARGKGIKHPLTPPAKTKHCTGITGRPDDANSLIKSKSDETQFVINDLNNEIPHTSNSELKRVHPDNHSPVSASPLKSPPYSAELSRGSSTLSVPKSPRTPRECTMGHQITHRFQKTFKMTAACGVCSRLIYFNTGLKCKECKFKCHRDCEDKAIPSCCLPNELVEEFKKKRPDIFPSPEPLNRRNKKPESSSIHIPPFTYPPDSSSNTSSCSTPSSPALHLQCTPLITMTKPKFEFPDSTSSNTPTIEELTDSQQSENSDRTVIASLDYDRGPNLRGDSQDSQTSESEDAQRWRSMREWDIPFGDLEIGEIIGKGRFGTVRKGYWHCDVAIKILNMDNSVDDDRILDQFRKEVSMFRKTRHENLVLFMGACMKPPHLAIVTSLSKGLTLYTHIHLRKDKFNMNKTTIVAQQISQGMGYLHAKGIIHKDLKTKNVFLENGKVVITDFGIFSLTKLCFGNRKSDRLGIPPGWLCYLSPEILRNLRAEQSADEELPFSKQTDVYAFGTVWYELLCGEWPFKAQPPEAIIFQVGKGAKQTLANLHASKHVKDLLMHCWMFNPNERPTFIEILNKLDKLPKKRLARSPSHPIHLSRSAESVF